MATKFYSFVGKAAWAKIVEPDETKWGKQWSIDLYMDKPNQKLLKESGMKLQEIRTPTFEGETGYRFKRKPVVVMKGDPIAFEAPKVYGPNNEKFEESIGNGSVIEVTVAVYDTVAGKGHRLESIKVLEHVPYVKQREVIRVGGTDVVGSVEAPTRTAAKSKPW